MARLRYVNILADSRAKEIANDLLGSTDCLDEHASEDERDDPIFQIALDAMVQRCQSCATWVKRGGLDQVLYCEECRGGEL